MNRTWSAPRRAREIATVPTRAVLVVVAAMLTGVGSLAAQQDTTLTLSGAARLALARHPSIVAASARADAADAGIGAAAAARLPSVRTEASAVRFQEPMIVAPLHGFDPEVVPDFDRTLLQGHVEAAYTLFDGGARGARVRHARALSDVADAQRASAARRLIAEVARAYLRVRLGLDVVAATDAQITALLQERSRAEQLLDEGKTARVTVLRVEAALARARADSAGSASDLAVARADLARLTGTRAQPTPVTFVGEAAVTPGPALERALDASAELRIARARHAAADASQDEARAALLPRLDLAARYNEFGSAAGDFNFEWQGGLMVSYPLFTGGARTRNVERASAEARAAAADVEAATLRVGESLDRALAALDAASARTAALEAARAQQEEVVRIELLALEAGAGTQTDYLAAEAELLGTRAALTEARHGVVAARIEIARITGELEPAWLENLERES